METEKLTISDIITRCDVIQLWAFIVVITGLVSGAFGAGYKVYSYVQQAKISQMELEKKQIQSQLDGKIEILSKATAESKLLHDKDRFLSLFLRFALAKEKWLENQDDDKAYDDYYTSMTAFDEYLIERVGKEKLRLNKGGGRLATVQFFDGTIWVIPKELHATAEH